MGVSDKFSRRDDGFRNSLNFNLSQCFLILIINL